MGQVLTQHVKPTHGDKGDTPKPSGDLIEGQLIRAVTQPADMLKVHYQAVKRVLDTFRANRLYVKGVKVHLFKTEIKFCRHKLSNGQRRAVKSKLEALHKWIPEVIKTTSQ